jgi:hypothetical protein
VEIPPNYGQEDVVANDETLTPNDSSESFLRLLKLVNDRLWIVIGAIGMGVIIYAGYIIMSSAGDKEQVKKGNKVLMHAAI